MILGRDTREAAGPRVFFIGFALIAAAIVLAGFARTFYFRPFTDARPLPPLVVVHGIVFTAWIVLLLVQTTLVASGRTAVHRRLGTAGGVLAALMVVVGWMTAIAAVRRGFIAGGNAGVADPLAGLALSLRDLLAFAALVAAGLYYRRTPETHKRLLVLATVNLLPAAVGRLPVSPALFPAIIIGLAVAGPIHDWLTGHRLHWTYAWGVPFTILTMLAAFPVGRTEVWQRFAGWLTG
jgi:hypothetical protein